MTANEQIAAVRRLLAAYERNPQAKWHELTLDIIAVLMHGYNVAGGGK